jgi:hypothetical protein
MQGESEKLKISTVRTETETCDTPLSSRREIQTGVCRSCASGYSVLGNRFADEKQRAIALAAHDTQLQSGKVA